MLAARLFAAPMVVISVVDGDRAWHAQVGVDPALLLRVYTFCGASVPRAGHVDAIEDAAADPRLRVHALVTGPPFVRSLAGAPIVVGGGRPRGALWVFTKKPRAFSQADRAALAALARQAGVVMELRRAAGGSGQDVRAVDEAPAGSAGAGAAPVEEILRHTIGALEARNQLQEQIIHILSHDLREPLNSMTNFARLLSDDERPVEAAEAARYARYIYDSGQRLKHLVEDLRAYVALERDSGSRSPIALSALMEEVCARLAPAIRSTNAVLSFAPLPEVVGNRVLLALLFEHLLANALKFVRPGEAPRVAVTACEVPDGWEITVADDGIGIAPRHQGVVFDLFRRLHPRDRYEGTGMGLAISRRVAELHDGHLRLMSTPGVGSRFTLHLPRVARRDASS